MQKKETAIEVKVGALVLFATGLLVAMVMLLGDFSFSDGMEFHVQFDNAGGLKPGADVAIAGINVGSVARLRFIENEPDAENKLTAVAVEATLRMDNRYKDAVREDSEFYITTRGILGEPYIEVVTRTYDANPVQSGQVLRGIDPPRMEIIIAQASELLNIVIELLDDPDIHVKDLIAHAASFMKNIDDVVTGNRDNIDATFDGVRLSSEEAAKLLTALNIAVGEGEGIKSMLDDARATTASARRIASRVDRSLEPVLDDVTVTMANARRISDSAGRILGDNEEKITASIDNVHAGTESLAALSSDAQIVVARVREGDGTVGALLAEREIYEDMKEMLRIIKQQPWKILWKE
ncbi:MAG: MlaD family protein [Bradymonadaceae bacterium]